MTGVKISALPSADIANATDQLEVNQGGTSRRLTLDRVRDYLIGGATIDWSQIVNEPSTFPPDPELIDDRVAALLVAGANITTTYNDAANTLTIASTAAGSGSVTSVSVTSANGLAGTVATPTTTPAITLSTTVNGVVKGNGTALSAAVAGTDYAAASHTQTASTITDFSEAVDDRVAALIVAGPNMTATYNDVANTLTLASTAAGGGGGTVTSTSVVSANGLAGTVATPTTTPAITLSTTVTGMLKGNGTAISAGTAGTDYAAASHSHAAGDLPAYPTTLPPNGAAGGALTGTYPNPTLVGGPLSNYLTTATAATTYQPLDADLTALAGLNATAGLVEQTAAAAFTKRLIGVANTTDIPTRANADARYAPIAITGTVTSASVVSANGLAGTVANATTTPAITLSTTVTGLLKGNATAISAAVAGTDYTTPANVTTALGSYLPLVGGTLAGPGTLTGTTATFSGNVGASGITVGGLPAAAGIGGDGSNVAVRGYATGSIYFQRAGGSVTYCSMDASGVHSFAAVDGTTASFTGAVTSVTAAPGTNTTQLASTAYVVARTPQTTVSSTAPSSPATNDVWIDPTASVPGTVTAETVLGTAGPSIAVVTSASAKRIELQFSAHRTGDIAFVIQAMVSGTPHAGANYATQRHYATGTTLTGELVTAATVWNLGAGIAINGKLVLQISSNGAWVGQGQHLVSTNAAARVIFNSALDLNLTPSTVTGWRIASLDASNLAIGSYLRAYVVT